jgi:hypothetical protein
VLDAADKHLQTSKHKGLRTLIKRVDEHPNRNYFVLKHATLSNLYGVDLMPEAVEIARLRLFLKLVSQIDDRREIEPLPDLEFNIKSGNTLVGASTSESVRDAVDILNAARVDELVAECQKVASLQVEFSQGQLVRDQIDLLRLKLELIERTASLRDTLDIWWADYLGTHDYVEDFQEECQPFHWFVEFPEVFLRGGFDVIIGNPPYVQKKHINYRLEGFATKNCPDIYAPCTERSSQICAPLGRIGMIVMLSLSFSDDFAELRRCLRSRFGFLHAATFSRRPSTLFTGAGVRSTIVLCSEANPSGKFGEILTTDTRRWTDSYRPHLMSSLRFSETTELLDKAGDQWIRTGDPDVVDLFSALLATGNRLGNSAIRSGNSIGFKSTALYYLSVYENEPPAYDSNLCPIDQPKVGSLSFSEPRVARIAAAVLAGRLAFAWWAAKGDDFDVTSGVLKSFPVDVANLPDDRQAQIAELAEKLLGALPSSLMYTLYSKKWLGNYDMKMMRPITDQIDEIVLRSFGLEQHLPTVRRIDARLFRSSGDAGNSIRSWPPS